MKLFTLSRLSLALSLAAGLTGVFADSIKLKNGTVLEGTITSETADSVVIEVQFSASIKDPKTVKRADIAEIKKAAQDEKEAAELLERLKDIPDGLSAAEYEKRIKTQIQPWLDKHKVSKKKADIEALLKQYTEDAAKLKAGGVRVRGEWVTAEELKWNDYNISARKLRAAMEAAIKAKKPVEAYAAFAKLEAGYIASVDYPAAAETIKKSIASVESAIARAAEEQPLLDKERKKLLASLTPEKRKETEELIKQELAEFKARYTADKKDKIAVPGYYAYDLKSIQESLAAAKKETARLAALNTSGMAATAKKFEQGLRDMNDKAYLSAKSAFEAVAKVHTKDATVKKMLDEATKAVADSKKPAVKK